MVSASQLERGFIKLGGTKDLKASNLIEVAEYAVTNRIVEEPAFRWWVCSFTN
jgi:hypothetical protein